MIWFLTLDLSSYFLCSIFNNVPSFYFFYFYFLIIPLKSTQNFRFFSFDFDGIGKKFSKNFEKFFCWIFSLHRPKHLVIPFLSLHFVMQDHVAESWIQFNWCFRLILSIHKTHCWVYWLLRKKEKKSKMSIANFYFFS